MRPALITVHCLIPTATMEAVQMVMVLSSASVAQDILETFVMLRLMSVTQLDARMEHVKI